jgi:hypothetical protein
VKTIEVDPEDLHLAPELSRSTSAKSFEERLRHSIDEMGLAEPLKVAPHPTGGFLVIDGTMRLRAIRALRATDPSRFARVPAYVLDYQKRFEIRFQSDIYQDLLPSQLATLVEHLHKAENVRKLDIARYIGVSPATLRNYTGLWRLMERGGMFAHIVELMDLSVLPASNPYAWLRLTNAGLHRVLVEQFTKGLEPEDWIAWVAKEARVGSVERYPLKYVELATADLPANCYRVGEDVRAVKRDLGLRRAVAHVDPADFASARKRLARVSRSSSEPVLRAAALSLQEYLG